MAEKKKRTNASKVIRIDPDVYRALQARQRVPFERPNDVIRRLLGLPPRK